MPNFTGKQQAFIDAYLGEANFNATKAAKMAGYRGNGNTVANMGFENLRKPEIANEIKVRLQNQSMRNDELLMRLGDQARIDIAVYYNNSTFDLAQFKKDGYGHLIKSIKKDKDGSAVYEFIDKLKSQELIGRHLAMFTDKQEITGKDGAPLIDLESWNKAQSDRQDKAKEILEQFYD